MLINFFELFINFKQVFSNLSIVDIQKTVDEVFVNDKTTDLSQLKETIANPLFGFFADKSGLIYNIRFFSPYINATYENKKFRKFIADESNDPITSLIIELYPSPAGQLTTSTAHFSNPLKLFENNKKESVKFFARLFTAVLNDRIRPFKFKFHIAKGEDTGEFNKRCEIFNKLKQLFFDKKEDSIFNDKTIKLILIHSYIINVLDPYDQGEGEDYFKLYLIEITNSYKFYVKELSKNSRFLKKNKFLEKKIEKKILQTAFDYYKSMNSFPYSILNKPESNKTIPSYIRSEDIFSEDKDDLFSDCADIALLHLCNCLFFYKGNYRIDHLPKASSHLNSFYKKHAQPYTLSIEIRNEWSKVIQDLNEIKNDENSELKNLKENSIYPTRNVLYCKKTSNEINPGIINMMNILIRITGIEDEKILEEINADNLEEKLTILIDRLSIKEETDSDKKSVATLTVDLATIREHETKINMKKDFSGTFTINFKYNDKTGGKIKFVHYEHLRHAELTFKNNFNSRLNQVQSSGIPDSLKSPGYQNLLFESFFFPENINFEQNFDNYFQKIFICGRIDNNDSSLKILEKICIFINELDEEKLKKNLENLMSLILDKVELSDSETKSIFQFFLCLKRSAFDNDDLYLAVNGYINSFEEKSEFLFRKWEELFMSEITEFSNIDIAFCVNSLTNTDLEKKKVKNLLINNIHNFLNIKELLLYDLDLDIIELRNIILKLSNPEKIENLTLALNQRLIIPKEIELLRNLKSIDLSSCELESFPDNLTNLISLAEIVLNDNKMNKLSAKIFKKFKNIKKLTLSETKISESTIDELFQFIDLEELNISRNSIRVIPESIKNLKNLKVLNIQYTEISKLPEELKSLKFLEKIYLSENKFSKETIDTFKDKIF